MKFNRVNGWTYKTNDDAFIIYNGGPNEWYSAKIDSKLVEQFGICSVVAIQETKQFHYSLKDAMAWVRLTEYKAEALANVVRVSAGNYKTPCGAFYISNYMGAWTVQEDEDHYTDFRTLREAREYVAEALVHL
jgi:hypothetical protein